VLAAVAAIALGLDTGFLTRVSIESTASLEQRLLDKLGQPNAATAPSVVMNGGPAMMSGNPSMMGGPAIMGNSPLMNGPD
jgi:hypothetical protein